MPRFTRGRHRHRLKSRPAPPYAAAFSGECRRQGGLTASSANVAGQADSSWKGNGPDDSSTS